MNDRFNPFQSAESSEENNMLKLYCKTVKIVSVVIAATSVSNTSNAQVQYTDVNPDFILNSSNASYLLDLNNDGNFDFRLKRESDSWWCGAGGYSGPNYFGGIVGWMVKNLDTLTLNQPGLEPSNFCFGYFQKVKKIQAGAILALNTSSWSHYDPLVPWKAISAEYTGCSPTCSVTNPQNVDLLIGLRMGTSSVSHLGWLRIVLFSNLIIVKDYAFETTPNRPIIMGAVSSSVGFNDIESTSKFVLNDKDLSVQFFNESAKYCIQISNLTGQVIESKDNVNNMWNYSFNQSGVYILSISNENGIFTKKLFVF